MDQQWYETVARQEEYESWLADEEAQKSYQIWLEQINGNPAPVSPVLQEIENGLYCE